MVSPRFRSGRFRKISKKTPGGKTVTCYRQRKPAKATCAGCGKLLHGVKNDLPVKMRKAPKTVKHPERPFGGMLCSPCSREAIKADLE